MCTPTCYVSYTQKLSVSCYLDGHLDHLGNASYLMAMMATVTYKTIICICTWKQVLLLLFTPTLLA